MKTSIFWVLAAAGATSTVAAAPPQGDQSHALEHVLVTVPFQRLEAETALPITSITGEELRDAAAATLGATLDMNPGLASASFGPGVGQPVIRGQQGPRVAVLQNSLLVGDASGVSADHGVAVEAVLADQIEVLRGPATLLYGGGAIGGVVNVIDSRIPLQLEPTSVTGEVRHGTVNDENTAVIRADGSVGQYGFHVDGMVRDSNDLEIPGSPYSDNVPAEEIEQPVDGRVPNTDIDQHAWTIGGSRVFDSGAIGFAYSDIQNEYGIPAGSHAHEEHDEHGDEHGDEHAEHEESDEPPVRIDMEKQRGDFRLYANDLAPWLDSVDWKSSYSEYKHTELEGDEVGTTFKNDLWQNRIQLVLSPMGEIHGVVGLQHSSSDFSAEGEESFIPKSDTRQVGLFTVHNLHGENTTYEIGLRVDQSDLDTDAAMASNQSYTAVSGAASVLWHFPGNWHIGLAYSHSERAPVVEELYSNSEIPPGEEYVVHAATGVIELGSADLDTETSDNIDLSLSWEFEQVEGYITLFYNDFSDYIYLGNTGLEQDEIPVYAYQQTGAEFYGVELDTTFQLGEHLQWRFFGDVSVGELSSGEDVPRMPPARLGSTLSLAIGPWGASASVLHALEQDDIAEFETETNAWTRLDASLDYRFEWNNSEALVFVRMKNIADEEIRNSVSFLKDVAPEPGRSVEFGVRFGF